MLVTGVVRLGYRGYHDGFACLYFKILTYLLHEAGNTFCMNVNTVCIPLERYKELEKFANLFQQNREEQFYYRVDFSSDGVSYITISKDEYVKALTDELYAVKKELAYLKHKPKPWYKRIFN